MVEIKLKTLNDSQTSVLIALSWFNSKRWEVPLYSGKTLREVRNDLRNKPKNLKKLRFVPLPWMSIREIRNTIEAIKKGDDLTKTTGKEKLFASVLINGIESAYIDRSSLPKISGDFVKKRLLIINDSNWTNQVQPLVDSNIIEKKKFEITATRLNRTREVLAYKIRPHYSVFLEINQLFADKDFSEDPDLSKYEAEIEDSEERSIYSSSLKERGKWLTYFTFSDYYEMMIDKATKIVDVRRNEFLTSAIRNIQSFNAISKDKKLTIKEVK